MIGTMAWLQETGGALRWSDQWAMTWQVLSVRLKRALRATPALRPIDLADITPPDSGAARAALALAQSASEPYLLNHCLRSYFWARLLDGSGKSFDDEVLFVAMMLHDLGLTEGYRLCPSDPSQCFTSVGARAAADLALRHGWSDRRAQLAAEAIALHLNVVVGDEHGREAQLLRLGSGADVAGLGIRRLPADQIAAVVERFPRHQLKRQIAPVLARETSQRPCCRFAFLHKRLGFLDMVANAPFEE